MSSSSSSFQDSSSSSKHHQNCLRSVIGIFLLTLLVLITCNSCSSLLSSPSPSKSNKRGNGQYSSNIALNNNLNQGEEKVQDYSVDTNNDKKKNVDNVPSLSDESSVNGKMKNLHDTTTTATTEDDKNNDDSDDDDDEHEIFYPELFKRIRNPSNKFRSLLNPVSSSCDSPYGSPKCTSSSSSSSYSQEQSCCCCCWNPIESSCAGNFNEMPESVVTNQIARTGFIPASSISTSSDNKTNTNYDAYCPWFDQGTWSSPLPPDFASLSPGQVSSPKSSSSSFCSCQRQNNGEDHLYGFAYLHQLIQSTVKNNNRDHPLMKISEETSNLYGDYDKNGIFIIAGDSISRQVFARMILRIRSRECSSEAEMRRSGALEMQFHSLAVYAVSTHGDAFALAPSCEEGLRFAMKELATTISSKFNNNKMRRHAPHRILFKACFIFDSTRDGAKIINQTKHLYRHHLENTRTEWQITQPFSISSIVFFPQVWYCAGYYVKRHLCMVSNQSNGVALSVIGTAAMFSIPKVVIATSMTHQKVSYYQVGKIRERNAQLKDLFPFRVDPKIPWIRRMSRRSSKNNKNKKKMRSLPTDLHDWLYDEDLMTIDKRSGTLKKNKKKAKAGIRKHLTHFEFDQSVLRPFNGTNNGKFYWSNSVRLYDFASRHSSFLYHPCDNVHALCTFMPRRMMRNDGLMIANKSHAVMDLHGQTRCPGSRESCQDMVNYLLFDDIMKALVV